MYKNEERTNSKRRNLLIWGLVLAAMAAIAVGAVEQESAIVNADLSIEGGREAGGDRDVSAGGVIDLIKFNKDEEIRDALRVLAAKYQKNIVPSPAVDGILAFTTLMNVTFEEAMNAVLGGKFEY